MAEANKRVKLGDIYSACVCVCVSASIGICFTMRIAVPIQSL